MGIDGLAVISPLWLLSLVVAVIKVVGYFREGQKRIRERQPIRSGQRSGITVSLALVRKICRYSERRVGALEPFPLFSGARHRRSG